jgi:hypothetical protein
LDELHSLLHPVWAAVDDPFPEGRKLGGKDNLTPRQIARIQKLRGAGAEKHTEQEVADELSFLREGKQVGDVSLLPSSFEDADRQAVDGTFGTGFAQKLDELEVGDWQEPVRSGLGWHLVKIESRTNGRLPDLNQIRRVVEREWSNEKRLEIRKQLNERLLKQYEVEIEWPSEVDEGAVGVKSE